jgi:thioredoxin-like negative regulator of GroEL
MKLLTSLNEVKKILESPKPALFYFSGDACSVCHALKPKIVSASHQHFPQMRLFEISINTLNELSAFFQIFTNPTVLVFWGGQEILRKGGAFSITVFTEELQNILARIL